MSKKRWFHFQGGYYDNLSIESKMRIKGGGTENLRSERSFGSLDSSMRRRPNATLHYHSIIVLLRINRISFREWFHNMPLNVRKIKLICAKRFAKQLRKKQM